MKSNVPGLLLTAAGLVIMVLQAFAYLSDREMKHPSLRLGAYFRRGRRSLD